MAYRGSINADSGRPGGFWDDGSSAVDQYFKDIQNSEGLSAADERKVAALIAQGDENAYQNLVKANLRFVVSVAKQYQNLGLPMCDLINEGNLGLMVAAKRFDGEKGFKFISYAVWWIRQSILQALAENARAIRLPLNKIGELERLTKAQKRLQGVFGRYPTREELADEMGFGNGRDGREHVDDLLVIGQHTGSLDDPSYEDEERATVGDLLPDGSPSVEDEIVEKGLSWDLEAAVETLDDREQRIMRLYFGLGGVEKPLTLEEIGQTMGLTRERVRQLKERALEKLRHPKRAEKLRGYVERDY